MRSLALAALPLVVAFAAGCARASPPEPPREGPDLGDVMVQVARRFELAGRAAAANRFELAAFEAGEIGELFEDDVPTAKLPKEGPTAQIRPMAAAFVPVAGALATAAGARDAAKFGAAFANTAASCNACHAAAGKAFIEIPSLPGRSVPVLDPLPAPAHP